MEEGHRFHRTCASHAQGSEGILKAVQAGMDSIEHGIFMTDECVELMRSKGTYLVPTLSALLNILVNADQGIPDYVVEKPNGSRTGTKNPCLCFIGLVERSQWERMPERLSTFMGKISRN